MAQVGDILYRSVPSGTQYFASDGVTQIDLADNPQIETYVVVAVDGSGNPQIIRRANV